MNSMESNKYSQRPNFGFFWGTRKIFIVEFVWWLFFRFWALETTYFMNRTHGSFSLTFLKDTFKGGLFDPHLISKSLWWIFFKHISKCWYDAKVSHGIRGFPKKSLKSPQNHDLAKLTHFPFHHYIYLHGHLPSVKYFEYKQGSFVRIL